MPVMRVLAAGAGQRKSRSMRTKPRATLGVYLSIYNVFQALLALVGIGGSRDG